MQWAEAARLVVCGVWCAVLLCNLLECGAVQRGACRAAAAGLRLVIEAIVEEGRRLVVRKPPAVKSTHANVSGELLLLGVLGGCRQVFGPPSILPSANRVSVCDLWQIWPTQKKEEKR